MAKQEAYDVAIIGGGCAGLAATMYSRRFGLNVILFDAFVGGTIMKAGDVENYPGFVKLSGIELANNLREHAMAYKPEVVNAFVETLEKKGDEFVMVANKKIYKSKTVIFATGTEWKKLKVPGEANFTHKGVHYCAVCDGNFYKGKTVAMVGAGDSAAKDALVLAGLAKKVYIIVRKENIHPEPINMKRVEATKNIEIIPHTQVTEIVGDKKVTGLKLDRPYKNSDTLPVDAIFIDVGHAPITGLAEKLGVKLNKKGEAIANKLTETNIPGFFAVGDVADTPFKQAIVSASEGSIASYAAYEFVTGNVI